MKQLKWIYITPLLFLTGCASSFNVGDSGKLSCRQSVKGMPCVTVRAAYYASQSYDPDETIVLQEPGQKGRKGSVSNVVPFLPEPVPTAAVIGEPKPLLMPAQVMRVWVNAYEDENGDLVYPSRVFSEVTQRKWNVGYSAAQGIQSSRLITPLVTPKETLAEEDETQKEVEAVQQQAAPTQPAAASQAIPDSLPDGVLPPLQ
jgi:conjugal transfer pilus assembly protein TraV